MRFSWANCSAYLHLCGWHSIPQVCQPHHRASCFLQICWECNRSHSQCHWERCRKSTSPSPDSWGTLLITDLHLNTEPLTTTVWVLSHNQFLFHRTVCPSNPYLPSLERILWGTMSKALLKSDYVWLSPNRLSLPLSSIVTLPFRYVYSLQCDDLWFRNRLILCTQSRHLLIQRL